MFYKIRRQDRALAEAEAEKILAAAPYGILSLVGENGYPYGVPVNAAWQDGKLYFHCAAEGLLYCCVGGRSAPGRIYHLLPKRRRFWENPAAFQPR